MRDIAPGRSRNESELDASCSCGEKALARGAWADAQDLFLEAAPSAEALEGLGKAAWWLNDAVASFAAREQAYRLYRQAGDRRAAGRMALRLGIDHISLRDAFVVGRGWLQRAEGLLDALDPGPEHGWLALWQGQLAMVSCDDGADARDHSASAADLARSLGLVPLERLALAQSALVVVREGGVNPAVLLDLDLAAAVTDDVDDLDLIVCALSQLMPAWEQVRDFRAIVLWWDVLRELPRLSARPCLLWLCRIEHAMALIWHGAWDEAEAELEASVGALVEVRGELAAEAMVRLAGLRRRRGRYEEAAALLEAAESQPLRVLSEPGLLLGWAQLALDEGDPAAARRFVQRALAALRGAHPIERLAALELLVHAEVAFEKPDHAHRALGELQHATCSVATDGVRASTRFAEGAVALGAGAVDAARSRLEEAIELFERASAHFETAQARIELAVALSALCEHDAARQLAATAREALCQLGAGGEADRAQARIPPRPPTEALQRRRPSTGGLTSRELEVVRLVAEGHSNDAIAADLIVSVRTVERHLSNIYEKVGTSGRVARAATVAYAHRHGLLPA